MNFNKKIIIISFLAFMGLGVGFYWFTNHNKPSNVVTEAPKQVPQEPVVAVKSLPEPAEISSQEKNSYLDELQQENKQLWKELAQYGIDEKKCAEYAQKYEQDYKNSRKEFEDNASKTPLSE